MFEAASWNARRGVGVGKGGALGSVDCDVKRGSIIANLTGSYADPPVILCLSVMSHRVQCADASPARSDTNGHERAAAVRGVSSLLS